MRATVDDLSCTEGKAELIGGRIVQFRPAGRTPNRVASRIARRLDEYAERIGAGEVYTGTLAFIVPELQSGRESFSPDASYYNGPFPANVMRFIEGPPTFAVEVRSENDYGESAEEAMSAKRADYFEAGTSVVWDVDTVAQVVRKYVPGVADPVVFQQGDVAEAEPAVPGWSVNVREIFA